MIVKSDRLANAILAALADKDMMAILDACLFHSISVNDMTRENNIPHTTAYRKIKWMLEEGLLIVDKLKITDDGKKVSLLRSTLSTININYQFGQITIETQPNVEIEEKIAEKLFSLNSI